MITKAVFEAALAHDAARGLPACRPERVEEVLWDWACNHDDYDVKKVAAELRHLFKELFAEERRKECQLRDC